MSLKDIFNASKIKSENEKLHKLFNDIGASDAIEVNKKIEQQKNLIEQLLEKEKELQLNLKKLEDTIETKRDELIVIEEQILLEDFALYTPKFKFLTSEEYKNKLEQNRQKQKQLIKDGEAVFANENWTVNNSKAEGKKMVNDMKKLLLRSFNNECDYCVDNVKFNNMESHEKRIDKSFEALNKLGRIMQATISSEYK